MKLVVTVCWLSALSISACSNEVATPAQMPNPSLGAGIGGSTPLPAAGTPAVAGAPAAGRPATTATAGVAAVGGAGTSPSGGGAGAVASAAGAGAGAGAAGMAGAVAGSSGTSAAGSAGAAGGGGTAADGFKPKCLAKGAELALIGDSWINYILGQYLAPRLVERARRDGALGASDNYNDQAVAGTSLANGGLGLISNQWAPAKSAAQTQGTTVKFVVMDGGGNDVLLGNQTCLENGAMRDKDPTCQRTVQDATLAGQMLQMKMKMDGVGQAVYFFYPHVPAGGWDVLDYSLPMAKATCEGQNDENYQCYFVDTRDAFQGAGNTGVAMPALIGPDGIHPSAAGADVLADLIWKSMKDNCMAQSASSGCCTP